MYKRSLSIKKELLIHLLFWVVWAYYNIMVFEANMLQVGQMHLFYITGTAVFIVSFYVNYLLVLPKVFKPFRWWKAALGLLATFLFFALSRYLVEEVITLHLYGMRNYLPGTNIFYYLYDNLYYSSRPIILSTVLWSVIFLVRTLEYNRIILEESKNTEIKFLKAQINPHFIFNTLNNIYSMVYFKSDKSLEAIQKLSEIMRFTTYEAQKEKIRLSEEVGYIRAYIELEQLRHQETAFVSFTCEMDNERAAIPPYILSPLVENALKHGVASDESPIEIRLEARGATLSFSVINETGTQKKDKLGGVGLDNLKQRLEIHYPGAHRLDLVSDNNRFTASLQIDMA